VDIKRAGSQPEESFHEHFKSVTSMSNHVVHDDGRGYCESAGGLSEHFAVQQRIQSLFRERANAGYRQIAPRHSTVGLIQFEVTA
jgi:hypothetical protein